MIGALFHNKMSTATLTGTVLLLALVAPFTSCSGEQIYKMCVPRMYYQDCLNLLKDSGESGIHIECVKGRDRLECLELINQRQADVLAVEPADIYVAYYLNNKGYRVISEFRTEEDKDSDVRYEGVILVKKHSNIHSLKDLQGKKSCHTGYGRDSGYKIPITKLRNAGVLGFSINPKMSSNERQLNALSNFFSQSCLVGKYSAHPEINRYLKRKYSNLCALCEDPVKCNYPDSMSGFHGAIRCLEKGSGDVAFTKPNFVKMYFGLIPGYTGESTNADDFEYLCEDGTRRKITGYTCSWAQRPWKGYISNSDIVQDKASLDRLQSHLEKFFKSSLKQIQNRNAANNLLIDRDAVYYKKYRPAEPEEYLQSAGYKDIIEVDDSAPTKIRLCVSQDIEMKKCEAMKRAAYSRDISPEIECVLKDDCLKAVKQSDADATVVKGNVYKEAKDQQLRPLLYETISDDSVYVVVVEPSLSKDVLMKSHVKFDATNGRARAAAGLLNHVRDLKPCDVRSVENDKMMIVKATEAYGYKNMQLLCPNLEKRPVTEANSCNFEAAVPRTVMIRHNMGFMERDNIAHVFFSLADKFGENGVWRDVFEMFGEYDQGKENVIFHDDGADFVTEWWYTNVNEQIAIYLQC